jgi:uncharacterized membrane protein
VKGEVMVRQNNPASLFIVAGAMCAALYAIGCYVTAYIPSPWGFGQFRPAVVIPAFFAAIFGPLPAALGAAIGTLIADSTKHGCLYVGSLIAAVPGNFVGFYIFGYILKRKFSWARFISASLITLTVANLIVAFLYVFAFKMLYLQAYAFSANALTYLSVGLTIWWFVTMLPFVLLITPPLIRVVAASFPSLVSDDLRTHALKMEFPRLSFSLAMVAPGAVMLLIGMATTFTQLGEYTMTSFGESTASMIELMYYVSGALLFSIGIIVLATQELLIHRTSEA